MCVAVPAEIVEILDKKTAKVCVSGNFLNINISLISPKPGDFVLIHAGYAMEIVDRGAAAEMQELFKEISDV